jgi:acetyltransferase-like isoleucine patch superfamily enzyme
MVFLRSELNRIGRRYARYCQITEALQHVTLGEGAKFVGEPILTMHPEASISIGARVTLNSDNSEYHVSMYAPVKLVADRAGATISIGDDTRIHGSCIHAWKSIAIGKRCLIAANCQIVDSNGHPTALDCPEIRIRETDCPRPVVICDDVWIGTGAIILPGVTIGQGSVVGAGAVVTRDIPAGVVVAGNPARVVRSQAVIPASAGILGS